MLEVLGRVIRVDVSELDCSLLEPLAETGCQQDLATDRCASVALCAHPIRERIEPARQGTVAPLWADKWIAGGIAHSELLSSLKGNDWSSDYVV